MGEAVKVLLLEDDEVDYLSLVRHLERVPGQCYEVEWVETDKEALAALTAGLHDIALFDNHLPGRNGSDVIRTVREGDYRHIPLVLVTGALDRATDLAAMEAGATDFLLKNDLSPEVLERTIRYAIRRTFVEARLIDRERELAHRNAELQEAKLQAEAQHANSLRLVEHLALAEQNGSATYILAKESEARYRGLAAESQVGTWRLAMDGGTREVNAAMRDMLGFADCSAWPQSHFVEFFDEVSRPIAKHELVKWSNGLASSFEGKLLGVGARQARQVVVSGLPLHGTAGTMSEVLLTVIDVTARSEAAELMAAQARHDPLTGLFNRTVFEERLVQALAQADRIHRLVALLYLDLDGFKEVNDSLGHQAGDELLRHVAAQIRSATRSTDTVVRMGGDEFAVLLTNLRQPEDAMLVVEQLVERLDSTIVIEGFRARASASIGISLYPRDAERSTELIGLADRALYRAKALGRGCYQFHDDDFVAPVEQRRQIAEQLRHAIENGELTLHYQPQIGRDGKGLCGFEALLRWNPGGGDPVEPSDFIPVAETVGAIERIGEWVLREACRQAVAWQSTGIEIGRMAVNLSARQIHNGDLTRVVPEILEDTGLAPEALVLEITESAILQNNAHVRETLDALNRLGIEIAMDDFGTGYSSLTHLRAFPVTSLKIDRSFVSAATTSPQDASIVAATIVLGHSLGLRVVAEGVETDQQESLLWRIGCDEVQGFHYSAPLPADRVPAWHEAFAAEQAPGSAPSH